MEQRLWRPMTASVVTCHWRLVDTSTSVNGSLQGGGSPSSDARISLGVKSIVESFG
jgi:hypothetical protein